MTAALNGEAEGGFGSPVGSLHMMVAESVCLEADVEVSVRRLVDLVLLSANVMGLGVCGPWGFGSPGQRHLWGICLRNCRG